MKIKYLISITLLLALTASADDWGAPQLMEFSSPDGSKIVRITPGDSQNKSKATILEVTKNSSSAQQLAEFPLINELAPVTACISNSGELSTFDNWGSAGYMHVAVCYELNGNIKVEFTLEELFPEEIVNILKKKYRSISSIRWRKGEPRAEGQSVIVDDVLGGFICITGSSAIRKVAEDK